MLIKFNLSNKYLNLKKINITIMTFQIKNIVTIFSAFSFFYLFSINNFRQCETNIYFLIISSIIYKFFYIFYNKNDKFITFLEKIDYLCILNLILTYYSNYLDYYSVLFINFIILLKNTYFYSVLFILWFITSIIILKKNVYIFILYIISSLTTIISYILFRLKGWLLQISWAWHLSITIMFMCVKITY